MRMSTFGLAMRGMPQDQVAYVAAVEVDAEPPAYGTITCATSMDACVVWIESLGVRQIALPTVASAEPWAAQLSRSLRQAAGRLRAWLHRSAQPAVLRHTATDA